MVIAPASAAYRTISATFLLLLVLFTAAVAQVQWQPSKEGIYNAGINGFGFGGTNDVYACSSGGIYQYDHGTMRWEMLDAGVYGERITGFPGVGLFLHTNTRAGILRRDDAGQWIPVLPDVTFNRITLTQAGTLLGSSDGYIYRSVDSGRIWERGALKLANTSTDIFRKKSGGLVGLNTQGIFSSTDDGITWAQTDTLPVRYGITSVAQMPNGNLVILTPLEIMVSPDDGHTWQIRSTFRFAKSIIASPTGSLYLLLNVMDAARFDSLGLYRSTDGGSSWKMVRPGYLNNTVAVGPDGALWIEHNRKVMRSTDEGITWVDQTPNIATAYVHDLISARSGSVYALIVSGTFHTGLFGPTPINALYRSDNFGASWVKVKDSLYDDPIMLDNQDNVYVMDIRNVIKNNRAEGRRWISRSTDRGLSWKYVGLDSNVVFVAGNQAGVLAAVAYEGDTVNRVIVSSDGGATWKASTLTRTTIITTVTPTGTILACRFATPLVTDRGLFRSTDLGVTWQRVDDSLLIDRGTLKAAANGDLYLKASSRSHVTGMYSIYRSTDDGITWIARADFPWLSDLSINADGHIFVEGRDSSFVSMDRGESWIKMENGLDGRGVGNFLFPGGTTVVGLVRARPFISPFYGYSWTQAGDGLDSVMVAKMVVAGNGALIAGTFSNGLYVTTKTTGVERPGAVHGQSAMELSEPIPNPVHGAATFAFDLLHPSAVTVKLYDMRGEELGVLFDGPAASGRTEVRFDAGGLHPGCYVISVACGTIRRSRLLFLQ